MTGHEDEPRASCCDYHAKHGHPPEGDPPSELRWGSGGPYTVEWDCDDDRQQDEPPYDHRLLHGDTPQ